MANQNAPTKPPSPLLDSLFQSRLVQGAENTLLRTLDIGGDIAQTASAPAAQFGSSLITNNAPGKGFQRISLGYGDAYNDANYVSFSWCSGYGYVLPVQFNGHGIHFPHSENEGDDELYIWLEGETPSTSRPTVTLRKGSTFRRNFRAGQIFIGRKLFGSAPANATDYRLLGYLYSLQYYVITDPGTIIDERPDRVISVQGEPGYGIFLDHVNTKGYFDVSGNRPWAAVAWTAVPTTGGLRLDGVRSLTIGVFDLNGTSCSGMTIRPWWNLGRFQGNADLQHAGLGTSRAWLPDSTLYTTSDTDRLFTMELNVVPARQVSRINRRLSARGLESTPAGFNANAGFTDYFPLGSHGGTGYIDFQVGSVPGGSQPAIVLVAAMYE